MNLRGITILFVFSTLLIKTAFPNLPDTDSASHLETRNRSILKRKNIVTTEPGEIMALMEKKFKYFETYTATFKELSYGRLRKGEIYYKKPHSLSVNYLREDGSSSVEVYANREKLFVYLKRLNLVVEQDLLTDDETAGDSHIVEVVNLDRLLESYNFNFLESKRPVPIVKDTEAQRFNVRLKTKIKGYHFLLTPKDKTQGLSHLELWVSVKGVILRAKCVTLEKRVIDFLFYSIKLNQNIADKIFEFVVPASAQVLKNSFMELDGTK